MKNHVFFCLQNNQKTKHTKYYKKATITNNRKTSKQTKQQRAQQIRTKQNIANKTANKKNNKQTIKVTN